MGLNRRGDSATSTAEHRVRARLAGVKYDWEGVVTVNR